MFNLAAVAASAAGANSDWIEAPQPVYPLRAAIEGDAGEVTLRVLLGTNGHVRDATIVKGSGKQVLDYAARATVLKWRLRPSKMRPNDIATGREVVVEFQTDTKDKLVAAAVLRKASEKGSAWKHGGSIKYPQAAFDKNLFGTVRLRFTIDSDGHPRSVQVLRSSGAPELDKAAVEGIQTWSAYREWVGESAEVPVTFEGPRRNEPRNLRGPPEPPASVDMKAIIESPRPDYPIDARANHWTGSGIFVISFGTDGRAKDVAVARSTGHALLDASVLHAFRRWRATVKYADRRVKVPVTFSMTGAFREGRWSIGHPQPVGTSRR